MLPSQILHVVQGNGPQGWLAAQSGFKHNLMGKDRSLCGPWVEEEAAPGPDSWPHLELIGAGHLHLGLQPLVPPVPACAPHGQLALGTAQQHPQLPLV